MQCAHIVLFIPLIEPEFRSGSRTLGCLQREFVAGSIAHLPNSSYRMIALCVRHKSRHLKRQRFATSFGILRAPSSEAKAWPGLWHRATPLCFALQWLAAWVRARHVELSSGDLKTPAGPTQPADCTGVGVLRIQWKTCVRMIHSLSETSSCCAMAWRIKPSTSCLHQILCAEPFGGGRGFICSCLQSELRERNEQA